MVNFGFGFQSTLWLVLYYNYSIFSNWSRTQFSFTSLYCEVVVICLKMSKFIASNQFNWIDNWNWVNYFQRMAVEYNKVFNFRLVYQIFLTGEFGLDFERMNCLIISFHLRSRGNLRRRTWKHATRDDWSLRYLSTGRCVPVLSIWPQTTGKIMFVLVQICRRKGIWLGTFLVRYFQPFWLGNFNPW